MVKKRQGEPWMPADKYGRALPAFTINLIVRDVPRSAAFYRDVIGAEQRYMDADFAALVIHGVDCMLHADHTCESHPWYPRLTGNERRGLGAELRLFGVGPDAIEARARERGATIIAATVDKAHGWRELMLEDPDGYVWAVGRPA